MNLTEFKQEILPIFEKNIKDLFTKEPILSATLNSAMHYSSADGGKRLRPLLLYATLAGFKQNLALGHKSALALELIHSYSLIHDDLPSMDDDDLRRNKPTCHIKFNEYTAILAGDGLQSLAFEILTENSNETNSTQITNNAQKKLDLIGLLAKAAGANGMVGGQMLDMQANADKITNLEHLYLIHKNKTGALIEASILMGAILANANLEQKNQLKNFAQLIGLAFQIQDDILDATSTTEELGKKVAVDLEQNKASFVNVLGLKQADLELKKSLKLAENILKDLEKSAYNQVNFNLLKELALYIIKRKN